MCHFIERFISLIDLKNITVSLWSFINASHEQYRNPLYGGIHNGVQTVLVSHRNQYHVKRVNLIKSLSFIETSCKYETH